MDKSLVTLLRFWGVFQFTQVFRVSTLYRVGGGRTARKFRKGCTVLRGNREMTGKYEYCITVPRTFVQDCKIQSGKAQVQDVLGHAAEGQNEIRASSR